MCQFHGWILGKQPQQQFIIIAIMLVWFPDPSINLRTDPRGRVLDSGQMTYPMGVADCIPQWALMRESRPLMRKSRTVTSTLTDEYHFYVHALSFIILFITHVPPVSSARGFSPTYTKQLFALNEIPSLCCSVGHLPRPFLAGRFSVL